MILSSDEIIQRSIDLLSEGYHKINLNFLKRRNRIIVFLDDDNYVEIEPKLVCIPCLHDEEKEQEMREELMRK